MLTIEVVTVQLLSEDASSLVSNALYAAQSAGLEVAVAVVDETGQLLAFQRHRNAFPAATELAIAKARTAAAFRRDTQTMQQSLEQGRTSYLALPGALPLAGGILLRVADTVVGALGVSGASSTEDVEIALLTAREAGFTGVSA
jgi:glc operon protein GlcG